MIKSNKIQNMEHCCDKMSLYVDMEEASMLYDAQIREYGILLQEESAFHTIDYCPWCGKKLPTSLRDEWFETMYEMFDEFEGRIDSRIPEEFKTDEWWKKRGL